MKKLFIFAGILAFVVLGAIGVSMWVGYENQNVELTEAINAKIDDNRAHYTKMWEIITQQAGVSSKYADDFKEVYPELMAGRYGAGQGQFMNWITEHNPNFDTSLYAKVQLSIEAQRESFYVTQQQLIDLSRQHNVLLNRIPSRWFLGYVEPIEVPVIVNKQSKTAFETGLEQEMKLYE
jgi:hypothetical protein